MVKTVPMCVNVITVLSALQKLVCVYAHRDGEDSNVICHVRNHISVKIVKTNANVKMMQRAVLLTVNGNFSYNNIFIFQTQESNFNKVLICKRMFNKINLLYNV